MQKIREDLPEPRPAPVSCKNVVVAAGGDVIHPLAVEWVWVRDLARATVQKWPHVICLLSVAEYKHVKIRLNSVVNIHQSAVRAIFKKVKCNLARVQSIAVLKVNQI